jgi:hypothetical protein
MAARIDSKAVDMAFDLVETIKLIGGLSGLASATFLIYDRIVRFRPTVSFRPHDKAVNLAIRNAMPESLIIDKISFTPPHLGIYSRGDLGPTLTRIRAGVEARGKGAHTSHDFLALTLSRKSYSRCCGSSAKRTCPQARPSRFVASGEAQDGRSS